MIGKDHKTIHSLEKHAPFFNWAKRYFWLMDEQHIGNLERIIIEDYHLQFNKIMKESSQEEFRMVWAKLSIIKVGIMNKKRKNIKATNVLDFIID